MNNLSHPIVPNRVQGPGFESVQFRNSSIHFEAAKHILEVQNASKVIYPRYLYTDEVEHKTYLKIVRSTNFFQFVR